MPPPPNPPGHLTGVLLRTVENLTQNEARQVGHLIVVSKTQVSVASKRISSFFYSACAPHSRVVALIFTDLLEHLKAFEKARQMWALWNDQLFGNEETSVRQLSET